MTHERVQILLEPSQRAALARRARQTGRSVSDLVRTYVTMGLNEENGLRAERAQALENARALKQRILKRRGGKPVTDSVEVLGQIREERMYELLGR